MSKLPSISCLNINKTEDEGPRKVKTVGIIPNVLSYMSPSVKKMKHDMDATKKIEEEPEDDEQSINQPRNQRGASSDNLSDSGSSIGDEDNIDILTKIAEDA